MKNNKPHRIGIDARFYGPLGKGLGRYTQEVVDNVLRIDQLNEYVIFLGKENFDELEIKQSNVKKVLADVRWYGLAEQFVMPFLIARERLDLMHFPHFNVPVFCPTKFVVTIHDLILTKFPTMRATTLGPVLYFVKNLFYRIIISHAAWRAKKIIAISEFTKQDIIEQFKVKAEKIVVTYEGAANLARGNDSLFAAKLDPDETLSDYQIDEPYLLYVGNAYPHKNLESLIKVFKDIHAQQKEIKLVLVGRDDYFYSRLKDYAKDLGLWSSVDNETFKTPVIFPGYVPDQKLEILFKRALAYVFPSKYEGFGLPPLEAMSRACPVVSSDKTSLPEILGTAALYFDPYDEKDMTNKILKIIKDDILREDLIAKGLEQVKKYDWWECANKTKEVYEQATI
ncbi:MAG: glycosyltransferase family 1 protein [Candidatus Falkowbacteria bacterium]|nr:glycosyltransferase family 1 protein [Candidatus Falkowbacteria bacterium]